MVRFFFAAIAALRTFFLAALLCFLLGIFSPLMTFEVLHRSFMGLGFFQGFKSAQIAAFAGLGILFPGIQAVFA
jgi:hypothetical protein